MLLLLLLLLAAVVGVTSKRLGGQGTHFVVTQLSGEVFASGLNDVGQLGTNSTLNGHFPQVMVGTEASPAAAAAQVVVDVCGGERYTCVVQKNPFLANSKGQAKCTGYGLVGSLGYGLYNDSLVLVPVLLDEVDVSEVFCGRESSYALERGTGRVHAWGFNSDGQLGMGNTTNLYTPALVLLGSKNITLLSAGTYHTCFLSSVGEVLCSGINEYGELGLGAAAGQFVTTPQLVTGLPSAATSVGCGGLHTCASTSTGDVFCWGYNAQGQLGVAATGTAPVFVPTVVVGLPPAAVAVAVSLGNANTFVVLAGNLSAMAFGTDTYGQFGMGSKLGSRPVPVSFGRGETQIAEIRGGFYATCAVKTEAGSGGGGGGELAVLCAGDNLFRQLGLGAGNSEARMLTQWGKRPAVVQPAKPTKRPTKFPTKRPTKALTKKPTRKPTKTPTRKPTKAPTKYPTKYPTKAPTSKPTKKK